MLSPLTIHATGDSCTVFVELLSDLDDGHYYSPRDCSSEEGNDVNATNQSNNSGGGGGGGGGINRRRGDVSYGSLKKNTSSLNPHTESSLRVETAAKSVLGGCSLADFGEEISSSCAAAAGSSLSLTERSSQPVELVALDLIRLCRRLSERGGACLSAALSQIRKKAEQGQGGTRAAAGFFSGIWVSGYGERGGSGSGRSDEPTADEPAVHVLWSALSLCGETPDGGNVPSVVALADATTVARWVVSLLQAGSGMSPPHPPLSPLSLSLSVISLC
jgi:hypothetical protein